MARRRGGCFPLVILAIILLFVGVFISYQQRPDWFEWTAMFRTPRFEWLNEPHQAHGELTVTFIDVGQGDSVFIRHSDGTTMLIDAGDHRLRSGERIIEYLQGLGVSRIDYMVGTHPHADHIGGMEFLIRNMEVGQILMPNVQHNTLTFERLMDAIAQVGLTVRTPRAGERIALGGAEVTVLSATNPAGNRELNDYSIVLKVRFGEHSFLFTGDGEHPLEGALVDAGMNISATVLDVGHHGSTTSTGEEFLRRVSPEIAVIQVGANNGHGHPHRAVLNRLEAHDVRVYRTDLNGNVRITTDGAVKQVNTQR